MLLLRDTELILRYQDHIKRFREQGICPLCDEMPIKLFRHWKIINNEYPYNMIAATHHMITSMRHITEDELTQEESNELQEIKKTFINSDYDLILEPTIKEKSIPDHFHLHLIVLK